MTKKTKEEVRELFHSGDYVALTIPSVVAQYPHLNKPDTKFGTPGVFKVNLMLSEDVAKEMRDIGFNVKEDASGFPYVEAKRKASLGPPKIEYKGKPYTGILGSGSLVTCRTRVRKTVAGGKEYLPIYLEKVDILDLVEYTKGEEITF